MQAKNDAEYQDYSSLTSEASFTNIAMIILDSYIQILLNVPSGDMIL